MNKIFGGWVFVDWLIWFGGILDLLWCLARAKQAKKWWWEALINFFLMLFFSFSVGDWGRRSRDMGSTEEVPAHSRSARTSHQCLPQQISRQWPRRSRIYGPMMSRWSLQLARWYPPAIEKKQGLKTFGQKQTDTWPREVFTGFPSASTQVGKVMPPGGEKTS